MPKTIELTVEIAVQRVSCPGVWLCQDGRVSLTVFAFGTSYQTCLLPPTFPLSFKEVFYFRKKFQESCALSNICCLLKEESIFCELLQWCEGSGPGECEILAQYLGALNDLLFPPNMCSNDGVDLLMRRSKDFPGILSPKIEIATKMRIDEVWNQPLNVESVLKVTTCDPPSRWEEYQRAPACHSARFHRSKCTKRRTPSATRSRSKSRSESTTSRSCCSLTPKKVERNSNCIFVKSLDNSKELYACRLDDGSTSKTVIESRYIEYDKRTKSKTRRTGKRFLPDISPCICDICKRYHELFHMNKSI